MSSGLTVIETQYPPEWLNDDQTKDSEEPVKDERAESSDAKACYDADTRHVSSVFRID